MKKIVLCVIFIFCIVSALVIPCFAVSDTVNDDFSDIVYILYEDDTRSNINYGYYRIYYGSDAIFESFERPNSNQYLKGFIEHCTPDGTNKYYANRLIEYNLNNGSTIHCYFGSNEKITVMLYSNPYIEQFSGEILLTLEFGQDFDLIVGQNGYLYIGVWSVPFAYSSIERCTWDLYGNIFPYDQRPQEEYDRGWNDGYDTGYESAINAAADENYNKGYIAGQASVDIVENSLQGFFNGLYNFFIPFLSIGIGSLTLYSLLGIIIVAFVVIIIIKVLRG